TDLLANQVLNSLQGKPIFDVVNDSGANAAPENSAAVAARFERQVGATTTLERTDATVRDQGGRQEMVARFRVGQDALKAAADRYGKVVVYRGITAALFFPTLEHTVRTKGELMVVASKVPEVKPGDVLLSLGGRTLGTLEGLPKIALETALKPGGLLLVYEHDNEPAKVNLGKAAKGPAGKAGGG
ncbi:MAG TPA: hypothetical protein VIG99_09840, partial [Myxococcaceae bacterium]